MHSGVLRTDSSEYVIVHPTLNPAQRISAENIHGMYAGELVAQFLHQNRGLCVALRPQEMNAFSED